MSKNHEYDRVNADDEPPKTKARYDDRLLPCFKWTMTIATVYAITWTIIFGVYRYDSYSGCSESDLLIFATVAFWLLLLSSVVLLICIIWLWQTASFKNVKLAEQIGFNCLGLLFIPLWLIVLIWGYVAAAKSTNVAGCAGLFYGAWVFAILTSVYIVLDCIELCVIGAFFGSEHLEEKKSGAKKGFNRKDHADALPNNNEVRRVNHPEARVTYLYPADATYQYDDPQAKHVRDAPIYEQTRISQQPYEIITNSPYYPPQ